GNYHDGSPTFHVREVGSYTTPIDQNHGTAISIGNSGRTLRRSEMTLPARDLPDQWLDFSALDVVAISAGQLQDVATRFPARWQALRDWTLAGGNLWIHDLGRNWERTAEVEALLGLSPSADGQTARDPLE